MQATETILNGVSVTQLQETINAIKADPSQGMTRFAVTTNWAGGAASETRVDGWELAGQWKPKDFTIRIDEPVELLGRNTAPNPQEMLLAAMNACIMATYVANAAARGIEIESLSIETEGEIDLRGFLGIDTSVKPGYDELRYTVRMKAKGSEHDIRQVHETVIATSPNYFNLASPVRLQPKLVIE